MSLRRFVGLLAAMLGIGIVWPVASHGEVIFHDPIPYRSKADTPFDMSGLGKTFFFDDFEDGVFNLPVGVSTSRYSVAAPGFLTDSVDGDDGVIDGDGRGGSSLRPEGSIFVDLTTPPHIIQPFYLDFDVELLGFLPNVFGIALTDGMQDTLHVIYVNDGHEETQVYSTVLDDVNDGGTEEDQFFYVTSTLGIRSITISNVKIGFPFREVWELDHLQFGLSVPETQSTLLTFVYLALLLVQFRRSYQ